MSDAVHGGFFVDIEGKLGMATLGDLIGDSALGIEYNIPIETIERQDAKTYALERAKIRLKTLLNRQLALQEKERAHGKGKLYREESFKEAEKELHAKESGLEMHAGKQFEQDVIHLLKEVQYDVPELGVEVEEANVVQDMDEKIDFIVKIKEHHRGVCVEESRFLEPEGKKQKEEVLFGIQFTINTDAKEKKTKQIQESKARGIKSKVDDILLIMVPMSCREIGEAHAVWRAQGCPPGGPARLYAGTIRAEIVKKILEKIEKGKEEERDREVEKYFLGKK
jgi:hypothetical protein